MTFVVLISIQIVGILIAELVYVTYDLPDWLSLANVVVIAVLTLGLAF